MDIKRGNGNHKVISKVYDLFLSINIKQKWEMHNYQKAETRASYR